MGGETVGLGALLLGLVFVIGAVRGTWKKVANDLLGSGPAGQTMPDQAATGQPTAGNPSALQPGPGGVGVQPNSGQCISPSGGQQFASPSASDCPPGWSFVPPVTAATPQSLMATGPAQGGTTYQ